MKGRDWKKIIGGMDDRTLMEAEVSLHNLLGWVGFRKAYEGQGLEDIKGWIRDELDRRGKVWGTIIMKWNPAAAGKGQMASEPVKSEEVERERIYKRIKRIPNKEEESYQLGQLHGRFKTLADLDKEVNVILLKENDEEAVREFAENYLKP